MARIRNNRNYHYTYTRDGNTIICTSSFAKKEVCGIARCAPGDTFDEEFGKKLAKLRCDLKIANKRTNYAEDRERKARQKMKNAEHEHDKAINYMFDAHEETAALYEKLNDMMKKFK